MNWSVFPYIIRCIFQVRGFPHTLLSTVCSRCRTGLFAHTSGVHCMFQGQDWPVCPYKWCPLYISGAGLACFPIQVVSTVYFRCGLVCFPIHAVSTYDMVRHTILKGITQRTTSSFKSTSHLFGTILLFSITCLWCCKSPYLQFYYDYSHLKTWTS